MLSFEGCDFAKDSYGGVQGDGGRGGIVGVERDSDNAKVAFCGVDEARFACRLEIGEGLVIGKWENRRRRTIMRLSGVMNAVEQGVSRPKSGLLDMVLWARTAWRRSWKDSMTTPDFC